MFALFVSQSIQFLVSKVKRISGMAVTRVPIHANMNGVQLSFLSHFPSSLMFVDSILCYVILSVCVCVDIVCIVLSHSLFAIELN